MTSAAGASRAACPANSRAGRIWPWMSERPAREFAGHAARLAPAAEVTILEPGESLPAFGA